MKYSRQILSKQLIQNGYITDAPMDILGLTNGYPITDMQYSFGKIKSRKYVAVSGNATTYGTSVTSNLANWSTLNNTSSNIPSRIIWDGVKWIMTRSDTNDLLYSYNSETYTAVDVSSSTIDCIAYKNSIYPGVIRYVGIGKGGIFASMDGTHWTLSSTLINNSATPQIGRVIWNGKLWVAVGNGASYAIAYSYDGISWTGVSNSKTLFDLSGGAIDVAWNGQTFVAVGANSSGYIVALSSDGITWSNSLSGTPYQLTGVVATGVLQGIQINLPKPGINYTSYTLLTSSSSYTTTTVTNPDLSGGTPSLAVPSANTSFYRGLVCTSYGVVMGGDINTGHLQYSTDYGSTWANLSDFFLTTNGLGIFPICLSSNAQIILIGTNTLGYLSTNGGSTWTSINSGSINSIVSNACSLTGAEMIVWSKTNGLFLSLNSGTNWAAGFNFSTQFQYACTTSKDGSLFFMIPYTNGSLAVGATSLYYVSRTTLQSSITSAWSSVSIGTNLDFSIGSNIGSNVLASNLTGSIIYTGAAYSGATSRTPRSKISKITGSPGSYTVTTLTFDSAVDGSNNYCQNIECSSDGNTVVVIGGPSSSLSSFYYISLDAGSTWSRYTLPTSGSSTYMNCTCSPDGKNVYIGANVNSNQQYGSYLIRIGYQGITTTFTTTTYTLTGLTSTSSYAITVSGNLPGGVTNTLYTGSVTTL